MLCPGPGFGQVDAEAVRYLHPCLSHSTSVCWVSAVCQALHWGYDGKKEPEAGRRECVNLLCHCPLWGVVGASGLFELQVRHLENG